MKITAKYLKSVYDNGDYGLRDASFEIADGDFAVVVGESGCGKTTLLKAIAGLAKQTAGELYFDGLSANKVPAKDRNVSMVFQEYLLYPSFTVWENLATALEREKLPREQEDERISKTLEMFGLSHLGGQLPRVLSGGQQQRVALAKAVVTQPRAILFDEPLANVADAQRAEYVQLLKELKTKLPQTTFVYVTHKIGEALQLANTLIVMKQGKVLQCGNAQFVLHNPFSAQVLSALCGETQQEGEKIFNPFARKWQTFGKHGLEEGQKREYVFQGNFDGKTLCFANATVVADENFRMRFIGNYGKVKVVVPSCKMHSEKLDGDVEICLDDCQNSRYVGENAHGSHQFSNADLQFLESNRYVALDDLDLLDEAEERVLAHYRVYDATCPCGKLFGKLRLPCGTINLPSNNFNGATFTIYRASFATLGKQGLAVQRCLDEEDLGSNKLCYCVLKGFDNYVALKMPKNVNLFFGKNKVVVS
ncbi:MAG: ABC transporter ATP-binding protein [Candidatus Fimimonas sp.]